MTLRALGAACSSRGTGIKKYWWGQSQAEFLTYIVRRFVSSNVRIFRSFQTPQPNPKIDYISRYIHLQRPYISDGSAQQYTYDTQYRTQQSILLLRIVLRTTFFSVNMPLNLGKMGGPRTSALRVVRADKYGKYIPENPQI